VSYGPEDPVRSDIPTLSPEILIQGDDPAKDVLFSQVSLGEKVNYASAVFQQIFSYGEVGAE
jgi:hypothetical protein